MKTRSPLVRDRDAAVYLGLLAYVAGTILLWDAFDNRGRAKPKGLRYFEAGRSLVM